MSTNKYTKFWKRIHNGRSYVRWREDGIRKQHQQQESRWIWERENGIIPKGMVIHHIDKNPLNNKISNLKLMSAKDHRKLHFKKNSKIKFIDGKKVKECPICKQTKLVEEYYFNKNGTIASYCKKCNYLKHREWVKNNKKRANQLSYKSWLKNDPVIVCPICKINKCRKKAGRCKSCGLKSAYKNKIR